MTNSAMFAVILAKLMKLLEGKDGFDLTAGNDPEADWDTTKGILCHSAEGRVLYVKGIDLYDVLDHSEVKWLQANELLVDGGAVLRVTLNEKTAPVLGIRFACLEDGATNKNKARDELSPEGTCNVTCEQNRHDVQVSRPVSSFEHVFFEELCNRITPLNRDVLKEPVSLPKAGEKALGGVPVLMCSGWHWENAVKSDDIKSGNAFDRRQAHARVDRIFDKAVEILHQQMAGQYYEGFVCVLGGDLVAGTLDDGLCDDEKASMQDIILDLALKLSMKIGMLAQVFPEVLVPCVSGSQGAHPVEGSKYPENSFDYQVYKLTAELLSDIPNVRFLLPDTKEVAFSTYHIKYLLTAGHSQVSDVRKRLKNVSTTGNYDYLLTAWREYSVDEGIIVNGRLGVSSSNEDLPEEPAQQALWLAHPEYGVGYHRALLGEDATAEGVDYPPLGTN